MTRKRNKNQNDDASTSKTSDITDLNQDLLLPIMMALGPIHFLVFSAVCKPWRSLALAHTNRFMGSKRPMSVTFSTGTCYFEDFDGRKSRIVLTRSTGRTCVGVTCGYMIMFGMETLDFLLVNPFTHNELHFPTCPFFPRVLTSPSKFRGILVFSSLTFQPVLVFSHKFTNTMLYCVSGNQPVWHRLIFPFRILDVHAFKGKIYTINDANRLFEVILLPKPDLKPLEMKNYPVRHLLRPEFVSSGKNMYVVDCFSANGYEAYEMDVEKLECVPIEKTTVEYAFFVSDWKSSAAVNPDTWLDRDDKSQIKGRCLIADMWYFPHDHLTVDTLQLQ